MKLFYLHFTHRRSSDGDLQDELLKMEFPSKSAALRQAKAIAAERGWFFQGLQKP